MVDAIYDADAITRQGDASLAVYIIDDKFNLPFFIGHIKSHDVVVHDWSDAFGAEAFQFYPVFAKMEVGVDTSSHQSFVHKDSVFGMQGW